MYGCKSWTIKKEEHQKIDAFKLQCWRRLLRIHWTARRSNSSTLKEINPDYSLEGLMLKLKLQYSGHLMQRADSLEKTLMQGKTEDRRRGWQKMKWLDSITDSMHMNLSKLQETVKTGETSVLHSMGSQRVGHDLATEQHSKVYIKRTESRVLDRYMYTNVPRRIIYNNQKVKTIQMSRWIDKWNVVYTYYPAIKRNEICYITLKTLC